MRHTISEDAAALAGGGDPAGGAVPEAARRAPLRALMDDSLLDELLARSRDEAGGLRLTGEGSMLGELIRAVLERALEAELTAHLGYEKGGRGGEGGNARNGTIAKTVQTGVGPVPLQVPRDRAGIERLMGRQRRYRDHRHPLAGAEEPLRRRRHVLHHAHVQRLDSQAPVAGIPQPQQLQQVFVQHLVMRRAE